MALRTAREALDFVREHGVVLVSAKGAAPRLAEAIAGEPIKGSWWGHPQGKRIFAVLNEVADSDEVLVCKLLDGKVTLVHRRLWPALVRLAPKLDPARIAQVRQAHTPSGKHLNTEVAFPQWVPADAMREAAALSEQEAASMLGPWLSRP